MKLKSVYPTPEIGLAVGIFTYERLFGENPLSEGPLDGVLFQQIFQNVTDEISRITCLTTFNTISLSRNLDDLIWKKDET